MVWPFGMASPRAEAKSSQAGGHKLLVPLNIMSVVGRLGRGQEVFCRPEASK